jgi:hypothetical protein
VAESNKFGVPKLQFGDTTPGSQADNTHCSQCEAMLADALDGTLSPADQALFDSHMATCGPCGQLLADARRGAAWLEMLRDPQPEPPAMLVERILEQTSGLAAHGAVTAVGTAVAGSRGVVLPFRLRAWAAIRQSTIGQITLQPRLAMTAAMAFFSVALTMDLTGMRIQDLNPNNLRPANLKRGFYSANARVVQYYEGLRVVYELESRVHDMESVRGDESQGMGTQSAPAPQPAPVQPSAQPSGEPDKNAPDKKGSKQGAPSGAVRRDQSGSRMSLARYVPARRDLAILNVLMWKLTTGTCSDSTTGTDVREGRLV